MDARPVLTKKTAIKRNDLVFENVSQGVGLDQDRGCSRSEVLSIT